MKRIKVIWLIIWAKLTRTSIEFLKCDKTGCPYIEFHKTLNREMVNKPCPMCETNLLTEDDYLTFLCEKRNEI